MVPGTFGRAASREGMGMLRWCLDSTELSLGLRHLKLPGSMWWAGGWTHTGGEEAWGGVRV